MFPQAWVQTPCFILRVQNIFDRPEGSGDSQWEMPRPQGCQFTKKRKCDRIWAYFIFVFSVRSNSRFLSVCLSVCLSVRPKNRDQAYSGPLSGLHAQAQSGPLIGFQTKVLSESSSGLQTRTATWGRTSAATPMRQRNTVAQSEVLERQC